MNTHVSCPSRRQTRQHDGWHPRGGRPAEGRTLGN